MDDHTHQQEAVALLEELGLKEYEARSFVALTRLPEATAKEISEISEVPRTRVYEAVDVLESNGLVETHQSTPQQFRAVSVREAVETLRVEFTERTERLGRSLSQLEPATQTPETEVTHEVWALSGETAIENRARGLIDEATTEVVLIVGHESVLSNELLEQLQERKNNGVSVVVGTVSESAHERIEEQLPGSTVFVSELEWLAGTETDNETEISRILLADRETILVSSKYRNGAEKGEQAVFGRGFDNGIVAVTRRLMLTGLAPLNPTDSGQS